MWTPLVVIYVAGLAVTAAAVLRSQMFKENHLMNAGSILLWPLYWSFFLVTLFINRSRH